MSRDGRARPDVPDSPPTGAHEAGGGQLDGGWNVARRGDRNGGHGRAPRPEPRASGRRGGSGRGHGRRRRARRRGRRAVRRREGLLLRAGAHRGPRRRRGPHRLAGLHARGPRRRLHRGRQAGALREAPRRRHRGREAGPRRGGRGPAEARPGGTHAHVRPAARRAQTGDRRGRDRPPAPLPRHPHEPASGPDPDRGRSDRQGRGSRHPLGPLAHGRRGRGGVHEPRRGRAGAAGEHPARPPPAHLPGRGARHHRGRRRFGVRLRGRRGGFRRARRVADAVLHEPRSAQGWRGIARGRAQLAGAVRHRLPARGAGVGGGRDGGKRDRGHRLGWLRRDAGRRCRGPLHRVRPGRGGPRRTTPRPFTTPRSRAATPLQERRPARGGRRAARRTRRRVPPADAGAARRSARPSDERGIPSRFPARGPSRPPPGRRASGSIDGSPWCSASAM